MALASYAAAGSGRVNAADADAIFLPELRPAAAMPPIVWGHSAGASVASSFFDYADAPGQYNLIRGVCDATGCAVIATDMGGADATFGNTLGQTRTAQAAAYLQANGYSKSSGGIIVAGSSKGSIDAQNYTRNNIANVLAAILILTVPDLEYAREQNVSGVTATIDADWGVSFPALLPAHGNPYSSTLSSPTTGVAVGANGLDARAVPMRSFYVSNDVFTPLALEQEFVTWWGTHGSGVNLGALGHSDAAAGAIDPHAVAAWLRSVGAI